ncbi:MAG TPA: SigB/SigF/SigG family RNA polymerase sigma factor [Acidimicrobiales bacterium]|nr:SigB/SigF/SigG family RNA polymerase sigma factor [Acidimicrobiales bacterium]
MTDQHPPDERFARYRATGDVTLRDELIEDHLWIANHVARRFMDRGEPLDDLVQVARLGLVKSLERFDPEHGSSFPAYAMPSVLGEVRRHFRDATWSLKVTRRAKELSLEVTKATNELSHELGRSPRIDEIASRLEVSEELVLDALDASAAYRALPLTGPGGGGDGEDEPASPDNGALLGYEDERLASTPDRIALRDALAELPERERRIVELRFYEGLTQSEIAVKVGTSQVHVSRLLRSSLAKLQESLSA